MITNNDFNDGYRRLNNLDHVVYAGYDGNDYEIYLWTGACPSNRSPITP